MSIILYTSKIEKYQGASSVIDYNDQSIVKLSNDLADKAKDQIDYIRFTYEFVRDKISHSADINHNKITCKASEVLREGHGICFAKSHLLAALLRCRAIPTGFCYQKLLLDDDKAPIFIYHGLNGVFIEKYNKWVRLDARGNKSGIDAQFMIENEQLAFPIRTELWTDLPTKLAYEEEF